MYNDKIKYLDELAYSTINDITTNAETWTSFLNFAGNHYRYNFLEEVLIYAQRPDATACAELITWNNQLRRWIKKDSKAIQVSSYIKGETKIRYLFDISDTYSNYYNEKIVWNMKEDYHNEIIKTLESSFGELNIKDDLAQAIFSASQNLAQENFVNLYEELKECDFNTLNDMDEEDRKLKFLTLLSDSLTYLVMKRCKNNPDKYFELKDFEFIKNFNTQKSALILGSYLCDLAKIELTRISEIVRKIEKNEKRTIDDENYMNYNESKKRERIDEYGKNNVSESWRLSNTTDSIQGDKSSKLEDREILKNERKILETIQERDVPRTNTNWQIRRASISNTGRGRGDGEKFNDSNDKEIQFERRTESQRPNALGKTNEQLQNSSRRTNSERNNKQLNFFDELSYSSIMELPSVEEQISNIENETEVNQNTSVSFDFNDDVIDTALLNGSGFEGGKLRIYKRFKESLSSSDNVTFLKNEYGIGGGSSIGGNYNDIGYNYDSKGILLHKGYGDNALKILITWSNVEKRINELVNSDRYLNDTEKKQYQKWLDTTRIADNQINIVENTNFESLEKNYKLSDGKYFHFHTNHEGYYYAVYNSNGVEIDGGLLEYSDREENETLENIRKRLALFTGYSELTNTNIEEVSQDFIDSIENEANLENNAEQEITNNSDDKEKSEFKIGQIIYLEDDRKYRVEAINRDFDQIVLLDQTMLEMAHYPISRNESYNRAVKLYKSNELNFFNKEQTSEDIKQENIPKIDYHIENNLLGEGTPKEKINRNIEAIKLIKKLEEENRPASKEEQDILSQYVGWGGIADVFKEEHTSYNELKNLLTESEYESAMNSTLNSFYTPPIVIKSIYKALENMGFTSGNMLEPSCRCREFFRTYTTKYGRC